MTMDKCMITGSVLHCTHFDVEDSSCCFCTYSLSDFEDNILDVEKCFSNDPYSLGYERGYQVGRAESNKLQ